MPHLYAVQMLIPDYFNPVKIGYSLNPEDRIKHYCGGPFPVRWLGSWPVEDQMDEAITHEKFLAYRLHGEWFYPAPYLVEFIGLQIRKPGAVVGAFNSVDVRGNDADRFSRRRLAQAAALAERHDHPFGPPDKSIKFLSDVFDTSRSSPGAMKSTWRW
jgi:hypothetical protein